MENTGEIKTKMMYKEIVVSAFAKAKKDSPGTQKGQWAAHISEEIEENQGKIVHKKTFGNYYRKYVENVENIADPKPVIIEYLCVYLGFESYKNYISHHLEEEREEEEEVPSTTKRKYLAALLVMFGLAIAMAVALSSNENKCMLWNTDHYEAVTCSGIKGEIALDQETLNSMKQLNLCKASTFFLPNDEPVVWYDKHHNKLTFFTMPGIHPENGRTLKPITQYIIDKYAEECE